MWGIGYNFDDYLDSDDEGIMYTDRGYSSTSDQEEESCFTAFNRARKASRKKSFDDDSSGDDFEKDMAVELSATLKNLTAPSKNAVMILENNQDEAGVVSARIEPELHGSRVKHDTQTENKRDRKNSKKLETQLKEGGTANTNKEDTHTDNKGEHRTSKKLEKESKGGGRDHTNKEKVKDKSKSASYDNIYFDSDDSEDEEKVGERRKFRTDDELLYDPDMDDLDQKFVDNTRRQYMNKNFDMASVQPQKLPDSDAVLSCPACFTTLCLDCQRHEVYTNQYRAMFVFNCSVDYSEKLKYKKKVDKKELWRERRKKAKASSKNLGSINVGRSGGRSNKKGDKKEIPAEPNSPKSLISNKEATDKTCREKAQVCGQSSSSFVSSFEEEKMTVSSDQSSVISEDNQKIADDSIDPLSSAKAHQSVVDVKMNTDIEQEKVPAQRSVEDIKMNTNIEEANAQSNSKEETQKHGVMDIGKSPETARGKIGGKFDRLETKMSSPSPDCDSDIFYPVRCTECNTKVAVFDEDEVYHFFDVLSSY